jgi:hypothetical protein
MDGEGWTWCENCGESCARLVELVDVCSGGVLGTAEVCEGCGRVLVVDLEHVARADVQGVAA